MDMTFEELHAAMLHRIMKFSATDRVPGMSVSEVKTEMELVLHKAWRTYEDGHGAAFDTWWYRCWRTHKANLVEAYFRKKRQMIVLTDFTDETQAALDVMISEVEEAFRFTVPDCPIEDPQTQMVWWLLSQGLLFTEVQQVMEIGRKKFDKIMAGLRDDPAVWQALHAA